VHIQNSKEIHTLAYGGCTTVLQPLWLEAKRRGKETEVVQKMSENDVLEMSIEHRFLFS
jgi:hypothetical protein